MTPEWNFPTEITFISQLSKRDSALLSVEIHQYNTGTDNIKHTK